MDQEPPVAVVGLPSDVTPSYSWIEVPLPAVPSIDRLVRFVYDDGVVIMGAAGALIVTTFTVLVTCIAAFPTAS